MDHGNVQLACMHECVCVSLCVFGEEISVLRVFEKKSLTSEAV